MITNARPAHLLSAIWLFLLPLWAVAQPAATTDPASLRAIYRLDYKLDSAVATPKSVQMILRINNGASCFRSTSQHALDSVYLSLSGRPDKERIQKAADASRIPGKNEFYYSVFKEPAKDFVAYHDHIGAIDHQYQEKAPLFHWKILPAKKMVAGYECQQAITTFCGRTWEAWFTRDIPVSEGPYKFYGLPGFIVKVRDTHDNYVFELLSFEGSAKPFTISVNPTGLVMISSSAPIIKKAKFVQAKRNDDLTLMAQFASSGNIIPASMQKDYFEELKRRNNPLELK